MNQTQTVLLSQPPPKLEHQMYWIRPNLSFDTYNLKCETLLITWNQYKKLDGQLITQIRLDLIQSVKA